MAPPAGWCGGSAQASFPMAVFTDFNEQSAHTVVNETLHGQPQAFQITSFVDAFTHPLHAELRTILQATKYRYSWKLWKPLVLLASPFNTTLMLDADALPCSATSLASLFDGFALLHPPPAMAAAQYWQPERLWARDILLPNYMNETQKKIMLRMTHASLWVTALGKRVPLPLRERFTLLWGREASPFSRCPHVFDDFERTVSFNSGVIIARRGSAERILLAWANLMAQAVASCPPDHHIGADQTLFSLAVASAGKSTVIAALSPFTACRYTGSWGIGKCTDASGRDETDVAKRCLIDHSRDHQRFQTVVHGDGSKISEISAEVRRREFVYQNVTWGQLRDVRRLENGIRNLSKSLGHRNQRSLLCIAAEHSFMNDEDLCKTGMQRLYELAAKAAANGHASGLRWSDAIPDRSLRLMPHNDSSFIG
eukprot:CAMPEP_0119328442 /NCGR_PEP_ID=MMETSP1333-20130426/73353_1 /TAXON_ID=418940 /ORGANISM="Scyphosphaera apsteinii, Strain RCC1455" /LENGTH=425 /DNA_ID=CAMNT_0007337297 /DNA_START=218 /DNA_END=1495 /DNA_ORIENTATION=-